MPDILGYWDRWADTWYYPRAYDDLSPLEKWAGREPTGEDKKKYEDWKKQKEKKQKNLNTPTSYASIRHIHLS